MKVHLYDKIIAPHVTEKSTNLSEQNKIVFKVISSANNSLNQGSYFITPGIQIRIPSQIGSILSEFNELNEY